MERAITTVYDKSRENNSASQSNSSTVDTAPFTETNNLQSISDRSVISNIFPIDNNIIDDSLFMFISKLYCNESITKVVVDDVVRDIKELVDNIESVFEQKLKSQLPIELHKCIDSSLEIDSFEKADNDYK